MIKLCFFLIYCKVICLVNVKGSKPTIILGCFEWPDRYGHEQSAPLSELLYCTVFCQKQQEKYNLKKLDWWLDIDLSTIHTVRYREFPRMKMPKNFKHIKIIIE